MVKEYVSYSSHLQEECVNKNEPETEEPTAPWLRQQTKAEDGMPLNLSDYYQLAELLVFSIQLPYYGYSRTV